MSSIPFIQVGVGNRGATILQDLLDRYQQQFRPVALVDIVPQFLDAAQSQHQLKSVPTYGNLGEALESHQEAEAVFIVTPAQYHTALIQESLDADKHVWTEKPLTYNFAEARELANLAAARDRSVVIGNQYQYNPLERQLQHLVQSGRYGHPFLLTYIHHRHRPQMRAFTGDYPALWEQGVHSLDSILAILGQPALKSVYALGQRPPHSNYNHDTITNSLSEFEGGIQVYLLVTFDSQRTDWEIRVECTGAALRLNPRQGPIEVIVDEQVIETFGPLQSIDPAIQDPYAAFHTAITTGRSVPTSIDINLNTIRWIDATVRSGQSALPVTL